jgi:orotidine-5'-phosphate decarboxylase
MEPKEHFGDRLASSVEQKNSAVCVGLDPRFRQLPESLRTGLDEQNLEEVASVFRVFCIEVIDAVSDVVPVVKPQAAFFEQLGPSGMQALADVIQHARQANLLVLLDGKRGDIGSTSAGYASAYLGESSAWQCDALTVNPYLGADTLEPFETRANRTGSGIFVLVKTSNPGSGFLQDQNVSGTMLYEKVARQVQAWSQASSGNSGYGNVGAVVGATYPDQLAELRRAMPNCWILIPGFGAQGGGVEDVRPGFDRHGNGAIVNSSRGIIFAYARDSAPSNDWQTCVRQAAIDMRDRLQSVRKPAAS